MNMEYLFGENRFVYDKPKDAPSAASSSSAEAPKSSSVETKKEAKEEARGAILDANKQARKEVDPLSSLSEEDAKKAFSFMEKEKFEEKTVEEMLALSENMSVYDLWRGGIARMKNEKDLKDNQGFDRMAAQFVKKEVDERGSTYLAVNLYGKDKYEMNIGAGHICPPSWKKVAIVDTSGNTRVGERKVPGIDDDVHGHKVGYYDNNGEYLAIFSGYKIYPLEISPENESGKKVIDEQVEKESNFYSENKDKLNDYVVEAGSYSVRQAEMSPAEIQRIRDLIPGLEDIQDSGKRVAAVSEWVTKNEIYAKHCWNWVERVYAIAGVTGKQRLYWNLDYAKGPDGKLVKRRDGGNIDARNGKHALNDKPNLLQNLKPGAHLCINNRNKSDDYGNHSVIFIEWVNKPTVALCANWMNPNKGFQKITRYDFNEKPVVAIFEPTAVEKKFTRLSPEEMAREEERRSQATPGRQRSSGAPSTSESYESAKQALAGSDKSELAAKGITPFTVRMDYQLTPEERAIYNRERKEAYRLGKMDIRERQRIMQLRYSLMDAIDLSFRALKMKERHRAYFYAYNDAVTFVESNYNPICINMKNGRVALSTASGAYQILNSTWADLQKRLFGNTRDAEARRRRYGQSVDFDILKDVNFSAALPGEVTPYEQAIFHNIYVFNGSRVTSGVMAFDNVFDKLQSGELSPEMQYSYQAYLYANWRNGLNGAKFIMQLINQGIPFPQNEAQAREYFERMPDCWQKRRKLPDFLTLVRACGVFVGRFNKNLKEMGAA